MHNKNHSRMKFAFQIAEIRYVKFSWPLILQLRFQQSPFHCPQFLVAPLNIFRPLPSVKNDWSEATRQKGSRESGISTSKYIFPCLDYHKSLCLVNYKFRALVCY